MQKINKLPPGKIIPLTNDLLCKKVFGDIDGIRRLEGFISTYFNVPYEEVKGNVKILESEKRNKRINDKRQSVDIIAEIELINKKFRLNIEMNLKKGTTLYRNFMYVTNFIGGISNKEDYSKIIPVHQISFDNYDVNPDNPRVIKRCFIKDETNTIIHNLIEIDHINIERCKEIWYNRDIKKEMRADRELILLGALVTIDDIEEFKRCLEEIDMEKEIKEEIIDTVEEYSDDDDILRMYYDREKDQEAIRRGDLALAKQEAREEGLKEGRAEGRAEGREEGREEGSKQKTIEIAKNLLKMNISIDDISKATELSIDEINKLNED